jgi:hypothetical protein
MTDILDYKAPRDDGPQLHVVLRGTRRQLAILATLVDYYMEANPTFDNEENVNPPTGEELSAARFRVLSCLAAKSLFETGLAALDTENVDRTLDFEIYEDLGDGEFDDDRPIVNYMQG